MALRLLFWGLAALGAAVALGVALDVLVSLAVERDE